MKADEEGLFRQSDSILTWYLMLILVLLNQVQRAPPLFPSSFPFLPIADSQKGLEIENGILIDSSLG